MQNELLTLLQENGLVQFGTFTNENGAAPVQFYLDLLGAYPQVLQTFAQHLAQHLEPPDILLALPDAIPLGTALSLQTGRPLVYSRGKGEAPTHDFVGAYDVGHPTMLVCSVALHPQTLLKLIEDARKVGLHVRGVLSVVAVCTLDNLPNYRLFPFSALVGQLVQQGELSKGQAAAIYDWLGDN
jgi:orotate phosphoribosyltransferase